MIDRAELIAAVGPVQLGQFRVLVALLAGTIGSSARAPDGWIRGRLVEIRRMEGIDGAAALKRLRRRAAEWPVRIVTVPKLGTYIEAAPDWPGLPETVRRRLMRHRLVAGRDENGNPKPVVIPGKTAIPVIGVADMQSGRARIVAMCTDVAMAARIRDLLNDEVGA